jgi:5-methyltetrahydropteroyltriglutamate--homocysteine methyltransferase
VKTSTDRILTTHTGSLPRPKHLIDLVLGRERDKNIDPVMIQNETANAVDSIVAQQVEAGIDVVGDGEMSKASYATYVRYRVDGIEPDRRAAEIGRNVMIGRDLAAHPDFAMRRRQLTNMLSYGCVGPLRYKDRSEVERDLSNLKSAANKSSPTEIFMTAPSPGILTRFVANLHYANEDA